MKKYSVYYRKKLRDIFMLMEEFDAPSVVAFEEIGTIEAEDLDELYFRLQNIDEDYNTSHYIPGGHRSMSVGDIAKDLTDGQHYMVMASGFKPCGELR